MNADQIRAVRSTLDQDRQMLTRALDYSDDPRYRVEDRRILWLQRRICLAYRLLGDAA